jgi:hypothetical protein
MTALDIDLHGAVGDAAEISRQIAWINCRRRLLGACYSLQNICIHQ